MHSGSYFIKLFFPRSTNLLKLVDRSRNSSFRTVSNIWKLLCTPHQLRIFTRLVSFDSLSRPFLWVVYISQLSTRTGSSDYSFHLLCHSLLHYCTSYTPGFAFLLSMFIFIYRGRDREGENNILRIKSNYGKSNTAYMSYQKKCQQVSPPIFS